MGISLAKMLPLQALGLISLSPTRYCLTETKEDYVALAVSGEGFAVMEKRIEVSFYVLTPLGEELRKILLVKPAEGLVDYVLRAWDFLHYHVRRLDYDQGNEEWVLGDDVVSPNRVRLVNGAKY